MSGGVLIDGYLYKLIFFCFSKEALRAKPECTFGTRGFEHSADDAEAKKDSL